MSLADLQRVEAFLEKWLGSEGNERANYQTFLGFSKRLSWVVLALGYCTMTQVYLVAQNGRRGTLSKSLSFRARDFG